MAEPHLAAFLQQIGRLTVWLVLLAAVFIPLERLFALRPQQILRKAVWTDLGYYFVSGLVPSLLLSAPLALVAWAVHRTIPAEWTGAVSAWPLWPRVGASLVVGEIGFYWGHRLSHEIPWLWRFHAIHHSAERMDWLVNTRSHPVDMVFTRLCGLVPLYVLGLANPVGPDAGLFPILLLLPFTIWGFFIHANVRWRFGPLEYLLASPHFHHWHHTRTDHVNRNYASMLPWLDRVFGTLYLPDQGGPAAYGIETPLPRTLPAQLLMPFAPRTTEHAGPNRGSVE